MAKPNVAKICSILEQKPPSDFPLQSIAGVAFDSREVLPGQLFVAHKGLRHDGHDFIQEAANRGAIAAIVRRDFFSPSVQLPLIKVDDPISALQTIAKATITSTNAKVIAITGSLGKTTTKDFIFSLLSSKYKTVATTGNQNTQVSMAASLLNNLIHAVEYFVLEMGMTAPGHIQKLVELAPPDIALITHIALVHAENFDTIEDIARTKTEIFSHPKTKLGIVNLDSPCQEILLRAIRSKKVTYSMQRAGSDFRLVLDQGKMLFSSVEGTASLPFVSLPAPHVYLNMLAACCVARACNMSWEELQPVLPTLTLPQHRLQVVEKQGITFVNDSYNASEDSMKAALTVIQKRECSGKRVAVIGQMRELGKYSQSCHKRIGEWALGTVDRLYCLGEECEPMVEVWQNAKRPVQWFLSYEELSSSLRKELGAQDVVLLKGSRPNALWRVLDEF